MAPEEQVEFDVRRVTTRVSAALPVQVWGAGSRSSAVCVDLSAGGVGLQMRTLPEPGEVVVVAVNMPGGYVVEAQAEVMHVGTAGANRCGLRFRDLDQGSLFAIHSFVASRHPKMD